MRDGSPDLRALAAKGPVHFVGVGGAGMCALAELFARGGTVVSGCDVKESQSLSDLRVLGIEVHVGHDARHVDGAAALVVTSAASADHPEVRRARELGVPVVKRAEALAQWVSGGTVVAVAGTHGKTTTTAMATEVLAAAGRDPTGLVGGRVNAWGGNLRFGSDSLFVVEADEYDRSFLTLRPDVAVVTNIEADHLDIYGDLSGVEDGFRAFLEGLRPGGRVIACADDRGASALLPAVGGAGYSYGLGAGSMLRAVEVSVGGAETVCSVMEDGRGVGRMRLRDGGRHNLLNALAAAAVARFLDVAWPPILEALSMFRGVGRRFERLGEVEGIVVIDDYAHHPTEIRATLAAARALFPGRRLVAAFQPHLFSRTRDFAEDFGRALAGADVVWVTDVFPARERPIPGVTAALIVEAARVAGASNVLYHPGLDALAPALAQELRSGDVLVTMGAGSIEVLGAEVLSALEVPTHA